MDLSALRYRQSDSQQYADRYNHNQNQKAENRVQTQRPPRGYLINKNCNRDAPGQGDPTLRIYRFCRNFPWPTQENEPRVTVKFLGTMSHGITCQMPRDGGLSA